MKKLILVILACLIVISYVIYDKEVTSDNSYSDFDTANTSRIVTSSNVNSENTISDGNLGTSSLDEIINSTTSVTTSSGSKPVKYNLKGKTIVNFGDSIFGNYSSPVDISTFIANSTNATVYNVGFGGCRMSSHPDARYDAFSMKNLATALVKKDWSKQDEAIKSLTNNLFIKNLATLKSINFKKVDIITISYGTNDFEGSVSLSDYEKALRDSIEIIRNAYPKIKIVLCTPIYRTWLDENGGFKYDSDTHANGWGYKLTTMVTKIKNIANEYGLFVIDNYNDSGINATNRTKYFPSNDGVHPNEKGRQMIAENMAKQLHKRFGK